MQLTAELSLMSFDDACRAVVTALKDSMPLAIWAVTRRVGDSHLFLSVADDVYGLADGDVTAWSDSLCHRMVTGTVPLAAPDVSLVPAYHALSLARVDAGDEPIGAYAGVPVLDADGGLFGTLCGFDPGIVPGLADHVPLLRLLATLLGQKLQGDRLRSEVREREQLLEWRAQHDGLTGLPNRELFLTRLDRALAERHGTGGSVAVLLLDLDDFQAVNDTFGHAFGDRLLQQAAERVQAVLDPGDVLARLGGDEFAVLLGDGAAAQVVADRVVRGLELPLTVGDTEMVVRGSVGISVVEGCEPGAAVDTVLAQADVAVYLAKRGGKGRLAHYDPVVTVPPLDDLRLREPLRRAIAAGEVVLHHQPVVDLGSGTVTGYEALARWTHEGEQISPEVFVPVAGRSGLLPALTESVLDQACRRLAAWPGGPGARSPRVGVNVPPGALADRAFPALVTDTLARYGVPPSQLVLEITEDALITDLATATLVTRELREAGVQLSLDDFGTGYSSLRHLRDIPLNSFKIDKMFTRDIDTDPAAARFVQSLLSLGRALGLHVVAEGVERAGQDEVLRRLGCDFGQGWFYGRPAPVPETPVRGTTGGSVDHGKSIHRSVRRRT